MKNSKINRIIGLSLIFITTFHVVALPVIPLNTKATPQGPISIKNLAVTVDKNGPQTRNPVVFVAASGWVSEAFVALVGFCVGAVCLYNEKPTGSLCKLDKLEEKIKNDMNDWCLKYYYGEKNFLPNNLPENYKITSPKICQNPSFGGVRLDINMYQEMASFPLRYGGLYPLALMNSSGDVTCVIFCTRFTHRVNEVSPRFEFDEIGKDIYPRAHPFVKDFVEAEDKAQVDSLKTAIKKWPSDLIKKLFKSKITVKEKKKLREQYAKLDQLIYGNSFGIESVYNMAEKNLAPSLVLQTIKYGSRGILCNPDYFVYFDAQKDIAVLIEKGTKKVIAVGHYSSDMGNLSNINEKDDKKEEEKNKEQKDKKSAKTPTDINDLREDKIKHVIKGSKGSDHKWKKLVPDENWEDIKKIITEVMETGKDSPYKNGGKIRTKEIRGEVVEVTYGVSQSGIRKIGSAWVK
jgi:hypothetical protein